MRIPPSLYRLGLLALFSTVLGCPKPEPEPEPKEEEPEWEVLLDGAPGALLSIWEDADGVLWTAGSDPDGADEAARTFDGQDWDFVGLGIDSDLWWVFGDLGDDQVWFVGTDGMVLRHDPRTSKSTVLTTGSDAMLFGCWGPDGGPLYAVGGTPGQGPPVLLSVDGDTVSEVTLPSGMDPAESLFKVWGTGSNDVWVIGDRGSVLHFDGSAWGLQVLPDMPRLVTIHGSGDDVVVVGGAGTGTIFQREGNAWVDHSPGGAPLNGVFVEPGGRAIAAGFNGQVLERTDGVWGTMTPVPTPTHWHAARIHSSGDVYVAGGDLTRLLDGVMLRMAAP